MNTDRRTDKWLDEQTDVQKKRKWKFRHCEIRV